LTGAIALAIVLVVAVVGMSVALQSQRAAEGGGRPSWGPRPAGPPWAEPRPPKTKSRRRPPPESKSPQRPSPEASSSSGPLDPILPELLLTGVSTEAKVLSVIDERTIGPVTRSRLTLRIEPEGGDAFEVSTRVSFPTPEARSDVKVGGTIKVRYDPDDHNRVVVDIPLN
jgi:hypothetical protein